MAAKVYELPMSARILPNGAIRFCQIWYPFVGVYGVIGGSGA